MKRLQKDPFRIIYPQYFDQKRSRTQGRRIQKELASRPPSENDLTSILNGLKLRYQVQDGVTFPQEHTKRSYRVVVFTSTKKSSLLNEIARRLRQSHT